MYNLYVIFYDEYSDYGIDEDYTKTFHSETDALNFCSEIIGKKHSKIKRVFKIDPLNNTLDRLVLNLNRTSFNLEFFNYKNQHN